MSPDDAMAAVRELFAEQGDADYIGEAVTQEEHALQCAELAKSAGAEGAVIAGAMLHGESSCRRSLDASCPRPWPRAAPCEHGTPPRRFHRAVTPR